MSKEASTNTNILGLTSEDFIDKTDPKIPDIITAINEKVFANVSTNLSFDEKDINTIVYGGGEQWNKYLLAKRLAVGKIDNYMENKPSTQDSDINTFLKNEKIVFGDINGPTANVNLKGELINFLIEPGSKLTNIFTPESILKIRGKLDVINSEINAKKSNATTSAKTMVDVTEEMFPEILKYIKQQYDLNNRGSIKTNSPLYVPSKKGLSLNDLFNNLSLNSLLNSSRVNIKSSEKLDNWIACIMIMQSSTIRNSLKKEWTVTLKQDGNSKTYTQLLNILMEKIGEEIYRSNNSIFVNNTDIRNIKQSNQKLVIRNYTSEPVGNIENMTFLEKYLNDIASKLNIKISLNNFWKICLILTQETQDTVMRCITEFLEENYGICINQLAESDINNKNTTNNNKIYKITIDENIIVELEYTVSIDFREYFNDDGEKCATDNKNTIDESDNNKLNLKKSNLTFAIRFNITTGEVYFILFTISDNLKHILLLKEKQKNLEEIWSNGDPGNNNLTESANLLSTDTYIDDVISDSNSPDIFKSKVNGMSNQSFLPGYTVRFNSDINGKKSCKFIVPTGSNFSKISKQMIDKPKFEMNNDTYSYKMSKLRKLISTIEKERSLCTGVNSAISTNLRSGFSNLSKKFPWGGRRKTRKLNNRKLKSRKTKRHRKKTNRRLQKKQKKTHKRH